MDAEITQHQPEPEEEDATDAGALPTTPPRCATSSDMDVSPILVPSSSATQNAVQLPAETTTNATPSSAGHSGSKKSRTASRTKRSTSNDDGAPKNKPSRTARRMRAAETLPDVFEWVNLTEPDPAPRTMNTEQLSTTYRIPDLPGWITSTGTLPGICDITVRYNPYCLNAQYVRHTIEDWKYVCLSDHRGPRRLQRPSWLNLYCTECLPPL